MSIRSRAWIRSAMTGASIVAILTLTIVASTNAASASDPDWRIPLPNAQPPSEMTVGGDGNMWFVTAGAGSNSNYQVIGRLTPSGQIAEFPLDSRIGRVSSGLNLRADGNLWFSMQSAVATASSVVSMTPEGKVTVFPLPTGKVRDLTAAANGYLWYENQSNYDIGRVAMDGTVAEYKPGTSTSIASNFTPGPDGNIWFSNASSIGTMSTNGTYTQFTGLGNGWRGTHAGNQDGSMWFTWSNQVYRIDSHRQVAAIVKTNIAASELLVGPGQEMWSYTPYGTMSLGTQVGNVKLLGPQGEVKTFPLSNFAVDGAVADSRHNLWLTVGHPDRTDIVEFSPSGTMTVQASTPTLPDIPQPLGATPDGAVWYRNVPSAGTIGSIERFDGAGNSRRYPLPASVMAQSLTVGPNGVPWFSYGSERYDPNSNDSFLGTIPPLSTERVSGIDRYASAVAISREQFATTAPIVYIASGANYPDALSAGPAASHGGGPLLLTPTTTLLPAVKAEVQRLHPSKIVVVGGPAVVSDSIMKLLATVTPNTVRIFGADRYATSRAIIASAFGKQGAATVFTVTGRDFPDALSAGAAAGSQNAPLLLVDGGVSMLAPASEIQLRDLGVKHIVMVGGPGVLSPRLQAALSAIAPTTRLSGADRYSTASAVNAAEFSSARTVFLATGSDYPDALAAAAWAGKTGSPLFIAPSTCVPSSALADITALNSTQVTVVGGVGALNANVASLEPCG